MRSLPALAALLALAACGDGASNSSAPATPVAGKAAPAGTPWVETVVKTAEGGYRMGNPDAPVKLVEYGSRTCPTCGLFGREGMQPLETRYVATGKVSYEFRDFMVHGAPDLAAGLLGICAGAAPFFPLLEQMYQNQASYLEKMEKIPADVQQKLQGAAPGVVSTTLAEQMGLIDFVKQRGIPEPQARACLSDTRAIDALVKLTSDASNNGTVTGTPTFIINGNKAEAATWSQLEPMLRAAGA